MTGNTLSARKPVRGAEESLSAKAYRLLRAQIFANELPPGLRALEEEFAFRLKMSRTPVREALVRLQVEGLVRIEPRRGVVVLPIQPLDMKHIYEVVTAIETAAVELLCRRSLAQAQLQPLAHAIADMDSALQANDRPGWAEADDRFHRLLLELCGNPRLAAIGLAQRDQVSRARLVTLHQRALPVASNDAHRATLEAISSGDLEGARMLHHRQRERASAELTALLDLTFTPPTGINVATSLD